MNFAGQLVQEMRALQAIHDRTLHLGQVESDPAILQSVVDRLEAFQRGIVDGVHRWALKDDMANGGISCDRLVDKVLEETGVREIEACIHAK